MRDRSGYYFKLIEKFKNSGLTLKEFCHQHSFNNKTYYYWKKKYDAQDGQGVAAMPCGGKSGRQGFVPLSVDAAPVATGGITIRYTDGTLVIFSQAVTPSFIQSLLPAFSQ